MDKASLEALSKCLSDKDIAFDDGLTDEEVERTEKTFNLHFPPDLRTFLQYGLPVSRGWVNWRQDDQAEIQRRINWPADSICYDIEHDDFWLDEWGQKPPDLTDALAVARHHVAQAPTLIPIFGHRFLPDEPLLADNPVFSVYQSDIIYYGYDLASYLANEFHLNMQSPPLYLLCDPDGSQHQPRAIRFWEKLL